MNETEAHPDSTTHAGWGAGRPRLLVASATTRFVFDIPDDGVTIGSAQDAGLRLPDTDPVHAVIRHDSHDEYALDMRGPGETSANVQKSAEEERRDVEVLRTGARFSLGPWRLVFMREEFADHGRPFGGREGGEFSDQQEQPDRPDYPRRSSQARDAARQEAMAVQRDVEERRDVER
ncbi:MULTISPECIES: FHA domain-containing protein [unclassified Microbacterium]|uniref:FHA domain-containing protein n=1 Tax=unclassified Microbacterium TaxID=2609290 RepID=UPI0036504E38